MYTTGPEKGYNVFEFGVFESKDVGLLPYKAELREEIAKNPRVLPIVELIEEWIKNTKTDKGELDPGVGIHAIPRTHFSLETELEIRDDYCEFVCSGAWGHEPEVVYSPEVDWPKTIKKANLAIVARQRKVTADAKNAITGELEVIFGVRILELSKNCLRTMRTEEFTERARSYMIGAYRESFFEAMESFKDLPFEVLRNFLDEFLVKNVIEE